MLKLITNEVNSLEQHRDACLASNDFKPYRSKELMPEIDKTNNQMILQEMPLDKTLMVTLSIIEQLQNCL